MKFYEPTVGDSLAVTGCGSGIGKAVLDSLRSLFWAIRTITLDIRKDTDIIGLVDVRDYKKIAGIFERRLSSGRNFLLANAGVAFFTNPVTDEPADFVGMPISHLEAMVSVNLIGQINVLHAFVGEVIRKGGKGDIVVVSSISADFSGGPNMVVYDATKAAVTALAKRLAPYQKKGIRINILQPGSVRTNIGGWNPDGSSSETGLEIVKKGQDRDRKLLGGREVSTNQLINWVKFLFFADHGANGAVITVDEGLTLMGRGGY